MVFLKKRYLAFNIERIEILKISSNKAKSKGVPLHATKGLGGRGYIASTHS
jgi:hypothetical protein